MSFVLCCVKFRGLVELVDTAPNSEASPLVYKDGQRIVDMRGVLTFTSSSLVSPKFNTTEKHIRSGQQPISICK